MAICIAMGRIIAVPPMFELPVIGVRTLCAVMLRCIRLTVILFAESSNVEIRKKASVLSSQPATQLSVTPRFKLLTHLHRYLVIISKQGFKVKPLPYNYTCLPRNGKVCSFHNRLVNIVTCGRIYMGKLYIREC